MKLIFPAPLAKEIVFSSLYILACFVKDKVFTDAWIYLWAFYFVPLIYISAFEAHENFKGSLGRGQGMLATVVWKHWHPGCQVSVLSCAVLFFRSLGEPHIHVHH